MKKAAVFVFALIGLAVSFQNCSAKTNFSGSTASSSVAAVSSTQPVVVATPIPIVAATPVPVVECLSYYLNGDGSNSGSYTFKTVPAGTKIFQKLACFGRPMNMGYQASYCSGALVGECKECLGDSANYTCGSNGYWAPSN